mmetsp:Transcript_133736/g.266852  ORF Transcript_133736/g.266852 Transcript_133736/m.266852 type:complete len:230 (-) Transcript_133736:44-733(-)
MPHRVVALLFVARQDFTQGCYVLMIPSVAISNGRAVGYTGNLVAVVPPSHDTRVGWRVRFYPFITSDIVVNHDRLSSVQLCLEHELWIAHVLPHHVAVLYPLFGWFLHSMIADVAQDGRNPQTQRPVNEGKTHCKTLLGCPQIYDLARNESSTNPAPEATPDGAHASGPFCRCGIRGQSWCSAKEANDLLKAPVYQKSHGIACQHRNNGPTDDHQPGHLQRIVVSYRSI